MIPHINRTISILYRYSQRYFTERLRPLGLEVGQVPVIMQAFSKPGVTQEAISAARGLDKGTVARAASKLEQAGLVRREVDSDDRRINHLYPTDRLLALRPRVETVIDEMHAVLYTGFTETEIVQTMEMLERMQANLSDWLDKRD